jgi:catechol 2,3-dioxygenase-like lactoylglutathione lyase family enzyme
MAIRRLAHVGLCVTDLERSTRFYCQALGFLRAKTTNLIGPPFEPLFGVETLEAKMRYLLRDDIRLELLEFTAPAPRIEDGPIPLYRQGLAHLCFKVDDVDESAAAVERFGGTVYPESRVTKEFDDHFIDNLMCADPDGTPVELSSDARTLPAEYEPYSE